MRSRRSRPAHASATRAADAPVAPKARRLRRLVGVVLWPCEPRAVLVVLIMKPQMQHHRPPPRCPGALAAAVVVLAHSPHTYASSAQTRPPAPPSASFAGQTTPGALKPGLHALGAALLRVQRLPLRGGPNTSSQDAQDFLLPLMCVAGGVAGPAARSEPPLPDRRCPASAASSARGAVQWGQALVGEAAGAADQRGHDGPSLLSWVACGACGGSARGGSSERHDRSAASLAREGGGGGQWLQCSVQHSADTAADGGAAAGTQRQQTHTQTPQARTTHTAVLLPRACACRWQDLQEAQAPLREGAPGC